MKNFLRLLSFFSLAVSASAFLVLLTGCASGSSSGSNTPTTTPPKTTTLAITSVSPKDIPVGSSTVTLTVTGTGFTANTQIVLNGVTEATTFVSSTEVRASIPAAQLATGMILNLSVKDGAQVLAADATNNVQVSNPIPTVASLAPGNMLVGSTPSTVTVTGTNFVSGVALAVNGSPRITSFVSATQLTVTLTAEDFANATPLLLNAVNPQPGGGASGTIAFSVNNPAPAIATVSPSAGNVGSAATTVTVTGTGFVAGTGLLVNGASRPAKFVSGTNMQVTLSAADLANPGLLSIAAVNAAPGGGISSSSAFAVNNPAPGAITALTPASGLAGAGASQVSLSGSGFVPSTVVYVNDSPRATTFVSGSQVIGSLTGDDLAAAGSLSIVAKTPAPGGGSSSAASFAINNPVPGALSLSPNIVATGTSTETAVTVTGANFVPSTVVQVNGSSRPTTYISSTQVLTKLTVADQATSGSLSVTAVNPAPGGGISGASSIAVNTATLGAITVSPTTVPAGRTTNTTITVGGANFQPGTTIRVNGSPRATTYVGSSQVTFVLLPSDVTTVGPLNIVAVNPAPNASISDTARLSVVTATATPVIASVSPTSIIVGSNGTSLYVPMVAGFNTGCILQWNGTPLTTSYSTSSTVIYNPSTGTYTTGYVLLGLVPASNLTTIGSFSITANCPTATTPTSNALTIQVTNPPVPTLSSLSATAGPMGIETKLTLNGTGFTASTVASFNGAPVPTTYTNSGALTVTLPASSILFPGVGQITVFTPAPGGGTSGALNYTVYAPITSRNMVYNPVNGLLYLSIPSSVGAPYGNSVVSMDPATGALGTPILVGSEPNEMAVTADGKYLWVSLDGASGVRKVDLTTNTAGLQFAINYSGYSYSNPVTAYALAAMPGQTDSVIVLQGNPSYNGQLAIYDAGVLRGAPANANYYSQYALQVDGSRNQIYVGGSGLYTYTYNSSGLTAKANNGTPQLASSSFDDMQLSGGKLYGSYGRIYDAEAGTLLATMYTSGTTVATGPLVLDAGLNKIFMLNSPSGYCCSTYNQIQIFNGDDATSTGTVIPISVPSYLNSASGSVYLYPHRLVRWGTNGLAFHTTAGVFSLRSNSVKDLSADVADLALTATGSGDTATGTVSTYTLKVTNSGPKTSTDVALALQLPTTGVLQTPTATAGSCASSTAGCSLGNIASGASVTITVKVMQTTAGTATLAARVSSSTTDNNSANDAATASLNVSGADYYLAPVLTSIAPNAIRSGSTDTAITVTGTNFAPGSVVMLGSTALSTTFTSSTQLKATVPADKLTAMGWSAVTISTPAPGGGSSNAVPLTVYQVLSLGLNHITYDPYSRKLMTSVAAGSSSIAGSSLVALNPETGTFGTPVPLAAIPNKLTLSDNGQALWITNTTTSNLSRYNMLAGTASTTAIPALPSCTSCGYYPLEVAVSPGTENTLALSLGNYSYTVGIYDYATATNTLTSRANYSSYYYNASCMRFLNTASLFVSPDNSASLTYFGVNANGLTSTAGVSSTLSNFGCFKLAGNKAYAYNGGVATLSAAGTATQNGVFNLLSSYSPNSMEPDAGLGKAFFLSSTTGTSYNGVDGILSFDMTTYLRTDQISLNMPTVEGTSSFSVQDVVRWGQDGLAVATSTGHIYLLRGPFVVPQLMSTGTAATLASSSMSTITHGAGNTLLTLTGSNFKPGVAVTWNGSYRTTKLVDATHVTVAIPASDLATAGSATVVATNPGASASGSLTITIN